MAKADGRGRVVAAATDGACSGNPGPGGWGALIRFEDGSVEEFGGADSATTNNRMELQAALAMLERLAELPRHPDLVLRTDSKYLIDGLGSWMAGWKRKGWKTAAGKPVLNQDLWQALDQARLADVPLRYVKGHSGDPDNDRVDQIAVAYSKGTAPRLKQGSRSTPNKAVDLPPCRCAGTSSVAAVADASGIGRSSCGGWLCPVGRGAGPAGGATTHASGGASGHLALARLAGGANGWRSLAVAPRRGRINTVEECRWLSRQPPRS